MATEIKLKRSSVTGKEPLPADLDYGELALNYADGVLYYKNTSNTIANISGGGAETDSVAPSGNSLRDGNLWWDAVNGRLKVYYDDGDPAAAGNITVSMTVNSTYTTNSAYSFNTGWSDRNGMKNYTNGDPASLNPTINIVAGDTVTITNSEFGNHPLFFVTQLDPITNDYNSSYNVENPPSNYGGGTGTTSYQFNSAGTYYYICGVHAPMVGTITVLPQDGSASRQWVDASPQGRGYTGSAGAIGYSENAPANPAGGQIWYDTKTGKSYMYFIVSGYGHWVLFADPTISDGGQGYSGSAGYTGSRGTISPRSLVFLSPGSGDEQTLFYADRSFELTEVRGVIRGGTSVNISVVYAPSRSGTGTVASTGTITSSTSGDTLTVSSSTIPANNYVWVEISSPVGIINELQVNLLFDEY